MAEYIEQQVEIDEFVGEAVVDVPGDYGLALSVVASLAAPRALNEDVWIWWYLEDSIGDERWSLVSDFGGAAPRLLRTTWKSPSVWRISVPLARRLRLRVETRAGPDVGQPQTTQACRGVSLAVACKRI